MCEGVCGELSLVKRLLLITVLVCTLAPSADAGFRCRRGGIRGLLAEARSTMAAANATMAKAERMMASAKALARDPYMKTVMDQSERVLKLEVEKKRLELELLRAKDRR